MYDISINNKNYKLVAHTFELGVSTEINLMKKLLAGLFVFGFLFVGFQVYASNDDCSNGEIYNSTTGQACSNYNGNSHTTSNKTYTISTCSFSGVGCSVSVSSTKISVKIKRNLKLGIKGEDVKALQEFLNIFADGSFGPKTQAKVMEWQRAHGLTPDGLFGLKSRQKASLTQ